MWAEVWGGREGCDIIDRVGEKRVARQVGELWCGAWGWSCRWGGGTGFGFHKEQGTAAFSVS